MGRPKGSKNKPKKPLVSATNRVEQIDGEIAALGATIAQLEADIEVAAAALAEQKAQLRTANRDLKKLEKEKNDLTSAVEAEERSKAAQEIVSTYLAEGKTVDELKAALGIE